MKKLIIFLLFALIHGSDGISCISGFTSVNNKCLMFITSNQTHSAARRQCNLNGGNLVSIYNSIDNTAVAQFTGTSSNPVWIGLNCPNDRDPNSCVWDDQGGNASAYNNFMGANPSLNIGTCVYMLTFGSSRGRWFSGNCDNMKINAICETTPNEQCLYKYNGYCYYPIGDLNQNDAQNSCLQKCDGNLVSIISQEENTFVSKIFKDPSKGYIRIGAELSSGNINSWIDGSYWNYTNVGYQNLAFGSCYSMSLINELVAPGKWVSSNCSALLPSICKRPENTQCDGTFAPPQCSGISSLTDNGVIYSPNYPYSYLSVDTAPCYYILTVTSNNAFIWFSYLNLDSKSSIELYSSLDTQTPFAVIDQTSQDKNTFSFLNSTTNLIKLVFNPCTTCRDSTNFFKWKANLGTQLTNTCEQTASANGIITSRNFPRYITSYESCGYFLQSSNQNSRVQLHFTDFYTSGGDSVQIYDGRNSTATLLVALSGNLTGITNLTYTSSGQFLFLNLTSEIFNCFRAVFNDFP